eukprot:1139364-Pelagomonas_calceolata.AAC.3
MFAHLPWCVQKQQDAPVLVRGSMLLLHPQAFKACWIYNSNSSRHSLKYQRRHVCERVTRRASWLASGNSRAAPKSMRCSILESASYRKLPQLGSVCAMGHERLGCTLQVGAEQNKTLAPQHMTKKHVI